MLTDESTGGDLMIRTEAIVAMRQTQPQEENMGGEPWDPEPAPRFAARAAVQANRERRGTQIDLLSQVRVFAVESPEDIRRLIRAGGERVIIQGTVEEAPAA